MKVVRIFSNSDEEEWIVGPFPSDNACRKWIKKFPIPDGYKVNRDNSHAFLLVLAPDGKIDSNSPLPDFLELEVKDLFSPNGSFNRFDFTY